MQDTFVPLLTPKTGEELVVHTELVKIDANVLERLQTEQVEGNTKRGSILDLEETHGTLLEDLSADPSVLLLDFKVYPDVNVSKNSPSGSRNLPPRRRTQTPVVRAHYVVFAKNNPKQSLASVHWTYRQEEGTECRKLSSRSSRKNQFRIMYALVLIV